MEKHKNQQTLKCSSLKQKNWIIKNLNRVVNRITLRKTITRRIISCFFALNAQHLSLNTQHFSIFLQSWAKYCWQVHKIKRNSFFFMEWSSADFSQFWSTTVKIWVLVGLLVTCHQYQAFHGFSWNLLIFVKSFVKLWGNSYIRTW